MEHPSPGRFRTAADLRAHLHTLGTPFDLDDEVRAGGPLAQPLPRPLWGRTVGNRFATHPMEGWDGTADGAPTADTLRRWRNFGRSGAAVVFGGEAFAVRPDGRANPRQLCFGPDSERHLGDLLAEVAAGAAEAECPRPLVGLQLTHSGRFARPLGPLAPLVAHHHPLLLRKYGQPAALPLLTDGELEAIGACYVPAAVAAQRAGFHFVDVKCCHGYLLHELLASKTRPGPYGGSLQNRMRLFERIVAAIRAACPGLGIAVRLSAGDTVPYEPHPAGRVGRPMTEPGVDPTQLHFGVSAADPTVPDVAEAILFVRRCAELDIPLVNVTMGSPYWNPHLQRPAAYPPSDGYLPPVDPLLMVGRHLAAVRELTAACPATTFVGTGYTYLQEWLGHVAQRQVAAGAVHLVGLGRAMLSYPDMPRHLLAGEAPQRRLVCRTFSDCTTGPRNGLPSGCYPLDDHYAGRPEAERIRELRGGIR